MSLNPARRPVDLRAVVVAVAVALSGCAAATGMRAGRTAEQLQDWDRAVAEYTKAVRTHPSDQDARLALDRAKLRAAIDHASRGRRLASLERYEEAVVEYEIASELNPTDATVEAALKDARQHMRMKVAVTRNGKTELQSLIDRTRDLAPAGYELPAGARLPSSLMFGSGATARMVFLAIAKFANINLIFDPAFKDEPLSVDLKGVTLEDALNSITASSHTFYRVTGPRTVTIVPDTPAKRREYEESVVRTFYLSNADLKEVIDLLRVVLDVRQISPITATNAISIKDTPDRIAAAARLIEAIDKARPEVVIDVELLEVDRTKLQEYGLQVASPGSSGINGSADVNRTSLTLQNLRNLTQSDVLMSGVPGIYYKLLKNDSATRTLANPQLRVAEGLTATARFGEQVPVPVTTFAPIAAGGVNTQPITSYAYRDIGVNIDITPRMHHDDDITLALKVELTSVLGSGFGGLPTFGNREISTTIRLKDGETNMLAGLIRDDERTVLDGIPGLSDLPIVGHLFASNHKESDQTDIILTLTPHIVRVLDLTEGDLRPFRLSEDAPLASPVTAPPAPPRDIADQPELTRRPATGTQPPATTFPQPLGGSLPGSLVPPVSAPKKPGGGSV